MLGNPKFNRDSRHLINKMLPTIHYLESKKGSSDCAAIGGPQAQEAAIQARLNN